MISQTVLEGIYPPLWGSCGVDALSNRFSIFSISWGLFVASHSTPALPVETAVISPFPPRKSSYIDPFVIYVIHWPVAAKVGGGNLHLCSIYDIIGALRSKWLCGNYASAVRMTSGRQLSAVKTFATSKWMRQHKLYKSSSGRFIWNEVTDWKENITGQTLKVAAPRAVRGRNTSASKAERYREKT